MLEKGPNARASSTTSISVTYLVHLRLARRVSLLNTFLAGDLLRAEQVREGSQYGDMIRTYIREGTIVPMEVTVKLLENAMLDAMKTKSGEEWSNGRGRFLIDGFPRKMDQALKFEEDVWDFTIHRRGLTS